MEMIKNFTDVSQSKKLAEILPLESADMKWYFWKNEIDAPKTPTFGYSKTVAESYKDTEMVYLPCWSLSVLLDILPEINGIPLTLEKVKAKDGYEGYYYHIEYKDIVLIPYSKNPVDACVAMIEKLHELKMLDYGITKHRTTSL